MSSPSQIPVLPYETRAKGLRPIRVVCVCLVVLPLAWWAMVSLWGAGSPKKYISGTWVFDLGYFKYGYHILSLDPLLRTSSDWHFYPGRLAATIAATLAVWGGSVVVIWWSTKASDWGGKWWEGYPPPPP